MRVLKTLALLALMLVPSALSAQQVEITPFAGFRFGGEIDTDDRFSFDPFEFEVDDSQSLGLIVDFRLTRNLFLEFTLSRQETELFEQSGLFDPFPGDRLFDVDIDYYHVGVLYQWEPGQIKPFVSASIGATRIAPSPSDFEDLTRFSASLGGGVKIFFNDHIGLRFEGRAFSTLIDDDDDDFYCDFNDCYRTRDVTLTQGEVRGGIIFAF